MDLTVDKASHFLSYSSEDGGFFWKRPRRKGSKRLRWTKRLPLSIRVWLAEHWRGVADKRVDWAEWILDEKKEEERK